MFGIYPLGVKNVFSTSWRRALSGIIIKLTTFVALQCIKILRHETDRFTL